MLLALRQAVHHGGGEIPGIVIFALLPQIHGKPVGEMLHVPDALGVYAGCGQVHHLGHAVFAIGAFGFDVSEFHIRPHVAAHRHRHASHKLTHAEAAGAS